MTRVAACPALAEPIPEERRLQAQREIVDLIAELHRAAQSLGKKLVGLQSADLKIQRRYLGAFHKFYSTGFHGSVELMEIEARLRGVPFEDLSDEYERRAVEVARQHQEWRNRCAKAKVPVTETPPHGFTSEQVEAILGRIPEPGTGRPQLNVIEGGAS